MMEDPNDEPQYGDRIPYVIARGDPGMRLVDRAVPPEAVLNSRFVELRISNDTFLFINGTTVIVGSTLHITSQGYSYHPWSASSI